jgi:hypothetical protein
LLASIVAGAFHIGRYVIMKPRIKPIVSICCAQFTAVNCFFALNVLALMAPDA